MTYSSSTYNFIALRPAMLSTHNFTFVCSLFALLFLLVRQSFQTSGLAWLPWIYLFENFLYGCLLVPPILPNYVRLLNANASSSTSLTRFGTRPPSTSMPRSSSTPSSRLRSPAQPPGTGYSFSSSSLPLSRSTSSSCLTTATRPP